MYKVQLKKPPIEEAICEFTFTSKQTFAQQLDLRLAGKFIVHPSMAEYSGDQRTQTVQILTPGIQPNIALRQQFPTQDGKHMVTLGPSTLAISVLRSYDGWEKFKPRIEGVIKAYLEIMPSAEVIRIGVKYVNRIVIPQENADAKEFLKTSPSDDRLPNAKLTNFAQTTEFIYQTGIKLLVTQATLKPINKDSTEFLLDIDTISERIPLSNYSEIIAIVEELHDIEGDTFRALITERAEALFNGT